MMSSSPLGNLRDKFHNKLQIKMEEQMVPSGGFSPQPENGRGGGGSGGESSFGGGGMCSHSMYGAHSSGSSLAPFDGSFDDFTIPFDLTLLDDMATVPSPMAPMEVCPQTSFYAASPSSSDGLMGGRAYSPDCIKGFPTSPNNNHHLLQQSPGVPSSASMNCNGFSNPLSPSNDVGSGDGSDNVLIKQYLADTSFQSRYNFKPLDVPIITVNDEVDSIMSCDTPPPSLMDLHHPGNNGNNHTSMNEIGQIDPVFINFAYEQMREDVQNTCNNLSISPDPTQWSVRETYAWLVHSTMDGSTPSSSDANVCAALRSFWNMDGRTLCSLSEDEFRARDALNGDKLYNILEFWKFLQVDASSILGTHSPCGNSNLLGQLSSPSGVSSPASSVCTTDFIEDIKLFSDTSSSSSNSSNNYGLDMGLLSVSPQITSPSSVETSSKNSSDDEEESEDEGEKPCPKGKPSPSPTSVRQPGSSKSGAHIHLWQFLKELLEEFGQQPNGCVKWLDQSRGVFKIEDSVSVARRWGLRKNRPAMNYDKLSRSIRQYYRKGIMKKTERSQRLVYQFCHPYGC